MSKTKTTAKATKAAKPGAEKKAKAKNGEKKAKKLSAIDAAAQLLGATKQAMNCKELIEAMGAKGLWKRRRRTHVFCIFSRTSIARP